MGWRNRLDGALALAASRESRLKEPLSWGRFLRFETVDRAAGYFRYGCDSERLYASVTALPHLRVARAFLIDWIGRRAPDLACDFPPCATLGILARRRHELSWCAHRARARRRPISGQDDAANVILPQCGCAPAAVSAAAPASDRVRPTTSCPASINSRTMADPMKPVAPVTKTRIKDLPLGWLMSGTVIRVYHSCQPLSSAMLYCGYGALETGCASAAREGGARAL